LIFISRNAGISCDEVLHYDHSVKVVDYFTSHGSDKSALNTPVSNLRYYGQSWDNIVTIVTKYLDIDDVYTFRHMMSALMGWLAIFITALFAVWIKDYRAGILVLLLYSVSPTFLGHAQNNLKDIPFATAYISGIYFMLRLLAEDKKNTISDIIFLLLSIAFCISIRAGGLILICYLYLFFILFIFLKYYKKEGFSFHDEWRRLVLITGISIVAYLMAIILWPYALQDPLRNVIRSYQVMAHYPLTFRQIFEGKVEWSDYMPWYYLVKSMAITIPLVVIAGVILTIVFTRRIVKDRKAWIYIILVFTIIFPVIFVLLEKSNLYSSWRQFLFLYPGVVLLSATGFVFLIDSFKKKIFKYAVIALVIILSVRPFIFMIRNHPYEYIYYNELVGGLKGAYGNYETDYYYTSQTEASRWLIHFLEENNDGDKVKVNATFSVNWDFRKHPEYETAYFRYEERSMTDWDYAIVVNRYVSPSILKKNMWPPENSIYTIYADDVPICAVLERRTKDDYYGYVALSEGKYRDAVEFFERAVSVDDKDEMIFYNFAGALYKTGQYHKADSILKRGMELNPDFDLIPMYLGNIAKSENRREDALKYYRKVIDINRKYYDAYIDMAELVADNDPERAKEILQECLSINPGYKPALKTMGDIFKLTDPAKAQRFYNMADSIN
jgi:tetratricopeptide (TPR) repeat protein